MSVERAKQGKPALSPLALIGLGLGLFGLIVAGLWAYYPTGIDWQATFTEAARAWRDPFTVPLFTNPPWVLALLPHAFLPLRWGNAINMALTFSVIMLVIWRYKGGWQAALLVFTSPALLDLARTNNIDWIPLLAFMLPPMWGLPLLAVKPQTLGAAALIWWKKEGFRPLMLVPLAVVIVFSFVIWGFWPLRIGLIETSGLWNFAPWPFFVPLGGYLLYRAYQAEDEVLGAAATPFLVPYFAPYSLAPLLALLACRYRKEAFFVWCGLWIYVIVASRRAALGAIY